MYGKNDFISSSHTKHFSASSPQLQHLAAALPLIWYSDHLTMLVFYFRIEPLTEEERAKVCSYLPRMAAVLEQEHKELLLIKKLTDQFEREVGAKDTVLSKVS